METMETMGKSKMALNLNCFTYFTLVNTERIRYNEPRAQSPEPRAQSPEPRAFRLFFQKEFFLWLSALVHGVAFFQSADNKIYISARAVFLSAKG
jgi:hypothetical protein